MLGGRTGILLYFGVARLPEYEGNESGDLGKEKREDFRRVRDGSPFRLWPEFGFQQ